MDSVYNNNTSYVVNNNIEENKKPVKTEQQSLAEATDALFKKRSAWEATVGQAKGLKKIPAFFVCLFKYGIFRNKDINATIVKLQNLVSAANEVTANDAQQEKVYGQVGKRFSQVDIANSHEKYAKALKEFYVAFKERTKNVEDAEKVHYVKAVCNVLKNRDLLAGVAGKPTEDTTFTQYPHLAFGLNENKINMSVQKMKPVLVDFKKAFYIDEVATFAHKTSKHITGTTCNSLVNRLVTVLTGIVSQEKIEKNLRDQLLANGHVDRLNKLAELYKTDNNSLLSDEVKQLIEGLKNQRSKEVLKQAKIIDDNCGVNPKDESLNSLGLRNHTGKGLINEAADDLKTKEKQAIEAENALIAHYEKPEQDGGCGKSFTNRSAKEFKREMSGKNCVSQAWITLRALSIASENADELLEAAKETLAKRKQEVEALVPTEGGWENDVPVKGAYFDLYQSQTPEKLQEDGIREGNNIAEDYLNAVKFINKE